MAARRPGTLHATAPPLPSAAPEPEADDRGFFAALPSTLLLPLRGPGLRWLLACSVAGAVFALSAVASRFIWLFGLFAMFMAAAVFVGMVFGYFRASLWGAASSTGEPNAMRELDAESLWADCFAPGAWLLINSVIMQVALFAYAQGRLADGGPWALALDPIGWALLLGPVLYWPLGQALMATRGSLSFWDLLAAGRVVLHAPLQVGAVVAVGLVTYLAPLLACLLLVLPYGVWAVALAAPALVGLPYAYSQAVQGAAMGHLFRTRPHLAG